MSIFVFSGGLGNQLFQLGAFAILSEQQPKLEASTCVLENPRKNETRRKFELEDYLPNVKGHSRYFRYYIDFLRKVKSPKLTSESLEAKYRYYYGEYQNHTTASKARAIIKPQRLTYINSHFAAIPSPQTAAIHLRLGDFITNRQAAEMSGVVGVEYLAKALTILREASIERIVVFSDEPQKAFRIISQLSSIPVAQSKELFGRGTSPFHDLFALSTFNNIVCTNSTYSFWGAYLGDRASKIICPRYFYRDISREAEYIPRDWMKC